MLNVFIGAAATLALILGVLNWNRVVEFPVAGSAGPTHTEFQEFVAGNSEGGTSCFASSTVAAVGTLPDLRKDVTCVDYTVNQADVTLTTFASTSGWLPQRVNESRTLWVRNASTTATADIIFAAGTGINLKSATSTKTLRGDTGADNYARIDFTRQTDTDVNAFLELFVD